MLEIKQCYYFSHDANAKDDPKCVMLIEQLGLEGFGIYWVLVEILRDQPTYRYPLALIPAIARRYNTTPEKMKIVVNGYGLFEVDESEFFSISLMKRMGRMDAMQQQRIAAGKKSAEKRLQLTEKPTSVERALNENPTSVEQLKESKVKEKKVKETKYKYGEFENVLLTTKEYERLVDEFGIETFDKIINFFSPYIIEKKYKSESHNLAIRRWVIDAVNKKNTNNQKPVEELSIAEKARRLQEEYERDNGFKVNNVNKGYISIL